MFSTLSLPFKLPSFLVGRSQQRTIDIDPLPTHDIEHNPERRARTLKHLLKANHSHNQLFYHDLELVNQTPDLLCTAYLLGATTEQLTELYEEQTHHLDRWPDIPGGTEDDVWRAHEIGQDDWREFLGKKEHQRNFVDFYEDELVALGYDWKQLVEYYLHKGEDTLASQLISGSSPAIVRLATAYQFDSRDLGIEGLAMLSCLHQSKTKEELAQTAKSQPSDQTDLSLTQVFAQIEGRESANPDDTCARWSALSLGSAPDAKQLAEELKDMQIIGTQIALASLWIHGESKKEGMTRSDVYIPLLTSHALRILLPSTPSQHITSILSQWLRTTINVYMAMGIPAFDSEVLKNARLGSDSGIRIEKVPGKWDWKGIIHPLLLPKALAAEPDLTKAVLALQTAEQTWHNAVTDSTSSTGHTTTTSVGQTFWHKAGTHISNTPT